MGRPSRLDAPTLAGNLNCERGVGRGLPEGNLKPPRYLDFILVLRHYSEGTGSNNENSGLAPMNLTGIPSGRSHNCLGELLIADHGV